MWNTLSEVFQILVEYYHHRVLEYVLKILLICILLKSAFSYLQFI
jgi:hypothetical protein